MSLTENLNRIREEIAAACRRAQRPESSVALMAVTKMHPAETILEAHAAGLRLFGENRVQEFQDKFPMVNHLAEAEYHLIGPLQSNKSTRAAELFNAIDTVDSLKIASRLNAAAQAINKKLPILLEIKLSHEESKHGIDPADLPALLAALAPLESLIPSGLMTVPPWPSDVANAGDEARPYFQQLRAFRDASLAACPTLTQLSMGMSNDFAAAIEEGSTCIRVGTALFGKRQYPSPDSPST